MKYAMIFALVTISFILYACNSDDNVIVPSGTITKQNFSITDFDKIDVSNSFNVSVTFSDTEEGVEVEANDNLQSIISVEKVGDELRILITDDVTFDGTETLNVKIKTPNIVQFTGTEEVVFTLQNALTEMDQPVKVILSGESSFQGEVLTNDLSVESSGESTFTMTGSTTALDIKMTGGSQFKNFNFTTQKLTADLSGESVVELTVNEQIDIAAAGESILRYKGEAVINSQNITASAQLIKVN